jgi:hypothetical protein
LLEWGLSPKAEKARYTSTKSFTLRILPSKGRSYISCRYYSDTSDNNGSDTSDSNGSDRSDSNKSDTIEELTEKYKSNRAEFDRYVEEKQEEISKKYIDDANRLCDYSTTGHETRRILGEIRNAEVDKLWEKINEVKDRIRDEDVSSTDYGSWTTRRNSPESDDDSNENSTNQNVPSSNTNQNIPSSSSANPESSDTSATGNRFRQDSSDINSEHEVMDFDDPTG